jgi:hypothetical protein
MARKRLVAALAAAAAFTVLAAPARAEPVTQWSAIAAEPLSAQGTLGIVNLAIVHGAVYDAVNAIDGGHRPYLASPPARPTDSKDAAVAAAAYNVLVGVLTVPPATLASDYAAALAAIPSGPAKVGGIAAGEAAAAAMLAARANDGRFGLFRFTAASLLGQWRPELPSFVSDPSAWLKDVTPFTVEDASQFRSEGPYALTSRKYAREFNEVKTLGRATGSARTQAQTEEGLFWAPNPPRLWSSIIRTLATQQGLSTVASARFYAMAYMAAADALITVWDDKAHWSFWRPITAIREAANDGNPATTADPDWLPLIATPPYPEHASGHLGLAGSIAATAQSFFGTDRISFQATNPVGGPTRSFTSLSQAVDEVVDARILEGIHFRHADEAGAKIGRDVARWVRHHFFQPLETDDGDHEDGND